MNRPYYFPFLIFSICVLCISAFIFALNGSHLKENGKTKTSAHPTISKHIKIGSDEVAVAQYDFDEDGFLNREEVEILFRDMFRNISDGRSSPLNIEERLDKVEQSLIKKGLPEKEKRFLMALKKAEFKAHDKNGDGLIQRAEFIDYRIRKIEEDAKISMDKRGLRILQE